MKHSITKPYLKSAKMRVKQNFQERKFPRLLTKFKTVKIISQKKEAFINYVSYRYDNWRRDVIRYVYPESRQRTKECLFDPLLEGYNSACSIGNIV